MFVELTSTVRRTAMMPAGAAGKLRLGTVVAQCSNAVAERDTVPASASTQAGVDCLQNRQKDAYVRVLVDATYALVAGSR